MAHSHVYSDLPDTVMRTDGTKNFTARVQHPDAPLSDDDIANKAYVDAAAAAGVTALQSIPVSTAVPQDGDALVYDAADAMWKPGSRGGSATEGRHALDQQRGSTVSGGTATITLDTNALHPEVVNFLCADAGAATIASQRQMYFEVPGNYVPGTPIRFRLRGSYMSIVDAPDNTKNLDLEVYMSDSQVNVTTPSDVCSTATQDFKTSATDQWRDYDYEVDETDIVAGDVLVLRIKVTMSHTTGPLEAKFGVSRVLCIIGSDENKWKVGRDFVGDLIIA